jgi:hypothetical protein
MKVERILYGMQTGDGKIELLKTSGVNSLLSFKSQDLIRNLKPKDSGKYLWFKTEQTIAYPVIIEVADKDPKHGGRTWVQNQTFLINIHEFLSHILNNSFNPLEAYVLPEQETFPEQFDPIII